MSYTGQKITKIRATPDFKLYVTFEDGEKIVDFAKEKSTWTGALAPLKSSKKFQKVFLDHGIPSWEGDIHFDPEDLYEEGVVALRDQGTGTASASFKSKLESKYAKK